jgi:hypothetical protein
MVLWRLRKKRNEKGKCPDYIVDLVQVLKHGGTTEPSNMQWQTKEDAKVKDKWE